mgnify:CR=1 FL=1
MNKPIFGYDDEGSNVAWTWNVSPIEKITWKTWKPKLNNVKIIYAGSSSKWHNPYQSPYAACKHMGEERKANRYV